MSITAVSSTVIMQAPDNGARVQLERDQRKLVSDSRAGASEAVLAADRIAITNGRQDVYSSGSTVDTYL
jgi:hypothetical protein